MSVSTGSPPDPQPPSLDVDVDVDPSRDRDAPIADDLSRSPQVLPVPMGPLRSRLTLSREEQPRPSFWKRIKLRTRGAELAGAGSGENSAARLSAIEQHLEQLDTDQRARFETLNGRLEEVWQSEEQLSHLADIQEKLDRLTRQQFDLSQSVAQLKRILGWLAVLIVVAAAGAQIVLKYLLQT